MRILVVDDDYVSRVKLKALLSKYGECDSAPDGKTALHLFEKAHAESVPYNLISLDIDMPDMRGQEVLRKIREWEEKNKVKFSQEVKVLMITVMDDAPDVVSSFKEGCESYLNKPITPEKIENALQNMVFQETIKY